MHPILRRLDELATVLSERADTVALLALGSAGAQRARLDEHSGLDFLVVAQERAVWRLLDRTDWLEAPCPVLWSYAHERNGRTALYADGILAAYRIVTARELAHLPFSGARVVWRRADAPPGLTQSEVLPPRTPYDSPEFHVGEALTLLWSGLHRELRGERLAASRLIQVRAVDRVVSLARLGSGEPLYRDLFDPSRRVERAHPPQVLPLATMVPGYAHNAAAATAVLDWLAPRHPLPAAMVAILRELIDRASRSGDSR
ncbi:hypothetical protein [Actinoplanes sp. NBRC 101535]|uniref:hypothetical protein n=1 Tax=Actinoplanes sp. NBRC 101535 TaxID=3032196 RepID=UPI0024A08F91|nr:hypothetical protein [Actinoplanes sp. NBRC 101535]GLY06801.1 hypothetical protein Acsp01_71800 [Actinoplanes sp. NBRC 101535]